MTSPAPIKYLPVPPDCIDYLPQQALKLLRQATKRTPAPVLGVDDVLARARNGIGSLYVIERAGDIIGIVYFIILTGEHGKTLNLVMASGTNFRSWQDDFRQFLRGVMMANCVDNMLAVARPGFQRLFREWKPIGTMYEFRVVH